MTLSKHMDAIEIEREDGPAIDGLLASSFKERLIGLIGTDRGETGDRAIVFERCASVHTFGMSYPIDVAFADSGGVVRKVARGLAPNRIVGIGGAARRAGYTAIEREASPGPWPSAGERIVFGGAVHGGRCARTRSGAAARRTARGLS